MQIFRRHLRAQPVPRGQSGEPKCITPVPPDNKFIQDVMSRYLLSHMNLPDLFPVICILTILGGCAPPTDVVDLQKLPQATRDAMLNVPILPLGAPPPPGTGSVGPVSAYGCGPSPSDAASDAVQQLQAKALRMQATAVVNVLFGPGGLGPCQLGYSTTASGIAVAARGVPPTYPP